MLSSKQVWLQFTGSRIRSNRVADVILYRVRGDGQGVFPLLDIVAKQAKMKCSRHCKRGPVPKYLRRWEICIRSNDNLHISMFFPVSSSWLDSCSPQPSHATQLNPNISLRISNTVEFSLVESVLLFYSATSIFLGLPATFLAAWLPHLNHVPPTATRAVTALTEKSNPTEELFLLP